MSSQLDNLAFEHFVNRNKLIYCLKNISTRKCYWNTDWDCVIGFCQNNSTGCLMNIITEYQCLENNCIEVQVTDQDCVDRIVCVFKTELPLRTTYIYSCLWLAVVCRRVLFRRPCRSLFYRRKFGSLNEVNQDMKWTVVLIFVKYFAFSGLFCHICTERCPGSSESFVLPAIYIYI